MDIGSHGLTSSDLSALQIRVKHFSDGSAPEESLTLSPDELTAVVEPCIPEGTTSKIRFETEKGNLFIRGSIDLSNFGHDGRYLNGCLQVYIEKRADYFYFGLLDLKGHEDVWLSGKALHTLGFHSVTKYAYGCPTLSTILKRTESIEVKDQEVVFLPDVPGTN